MAYPDLLAEALAEITEPEQIPEITYPALEASMSPNKSIGIFSAPNKNQLAERFVKELRLYLSDTNNYKSTISLGGRVNSNNSNCEKWSIDDYMQSTINMDNTTNTNGCLANNKLLKVNDIFEETGRHQNDAPVPQTTDGTSEPSESTAEISEQIYQW